MSISSLTREKNQIIIDLQHAKERGDAGDIRRLAEEAAKLEGDLAELLIKDGRQEEAAINLVSQGNCFLDCGNHHAATAAFKRALQLSKKRRLRAWLERTLKSMNLTSERTGRMRLIDLIPEHEDRLDAPPEWNWLMEPFRLALSLPPEVVARDAYVDVPAAGWDPHHLTRLLGPTPLLLPSEVTSLQYNQRILRSNHAPTLLIGEPGVGKTTWLTRFFDRTHIPGIQERFYSYRLDGAAMHSAFVPTDSATYVQNTLRIGLLDKMRAISKRLKLDTPARTMHPTQAQPMLGEQAIRETAALLLKHHYIGWVILDNLDQQGRAIQRAAIEWGRNVCAQQLRALIAIRPYTLDVDDGMYHMHNVTVPPPSFPQILSARCEYALHSTLAKDLVKQLRSGISVNLTWTGGHISDEASLTRLWHTVAGTFQSLKSLHRHLFEVHLGNLHEIMRDLRLLMSSGYFCQEMMRRLASHERRSEHEFLTAYVRGNYHHHRQTELSGGHMVNIYELPNADRKHRLLIIRFLQFLCKLTDTGAPARFSELRKQLARFGYESDWIDVAARLLVGKRLVLEVKRLVDWRSPRLTLEDDDELEISQSGRYYLEVLAATPRYIEAMADITRLDESVVEQMPLECRSADEGFRKGYLFMAQIGGEVEAELKRLRGAGLLHDFYEMRDVGEGFYYLGVQASLAHARKLEAKRVLSRSTVRLWEVLFQKARKFRDERHNALGLP